MKQQQVYNLKEFAAKYQLKDIFGAYAAHIHTDVLTGSVLRDMASERTLFYKILLVKSGSVKFEVVLGSESAEDEEHLLTTSDLLVVSPKHVYKFTEISEDFEAECVFVDEEISNDLVYHLSDDKLKAVLDIIHMIRDIVRHQHIYKVEMIQSMVNVLKLLVSELPYEIGRAHV